VIPLVFIDTETTGLDPESSDLLELSAIRVKNGEITDQFDTLVRPFSEIPPEVQKLTGISQDKVYNAPFLGEVRKKFLEQFLKANDVFVAHNAFFDLNFLNTKEFDLENPSIDTFELAQIIAPKERSFALESLASSFKIKHQNAHRALADVKATFKVWQELQKIVQETWPSELLAEVKHLLRKSNWTGKYFFEEISLNQSPKSKANPQAGPEQATKKQQQISIFEALESTQFSEQGQASQEQKLAPNSPQVIATNQELRFATEVQTTGRIALEIKPPNQREVVNFLIAKKIVNKEKNTRVAIATKNTNFKNYQELFEQFDWESLPAIAADRPEEYLCLRRWQDFIKKSKFDPVETIVILKVLRELTLRSRAHSADFGFFGPEKTLFQDKLSSQSHDQCSDDCLAKNALQELGKASVLLVPYRALEYFQGDYLILDQANDLEEILTDLTREQASSRVFADLGPKASSVMQKSLVEGLEFGFEMVAKFVSAKVNLGQYPEPYKVTVKDDHSSEFKNFAEGFREAAKELALLFPKETRLIKILENWQQFFAVKGEPRELKSLILYPDQTVAFSRETVNLASFFEELIEHKKGVILSADYYPRFLADDNSGEQEINLTFPLIDFTEQELKSNFNFAEDSLFLSSSELKTNDEKSASKIAPIINNLFQNSSGNLLAALASKPITAKIELELEALLDNKDQDINLLAHHRGNPGKAVQLFSDSSGRKLILAPFFNIEKGSFDDLDISVYFLQKFIFDPPGKLLIEERKKLFENEFLDYILPRSLNRFHKLVNQAVKRRQKFVFFCADPKMQQGNTWGKHFFDSLPATMAKKFLKPEQIELLLQDFFQGKTKQQNEPHETENALEDSQVNSL
jgi:DNA polymerase III epsilon subunit family exonuclease